MILKKKTKKKKHLNKPEKKKYFEQKLKSLLENT